MMAKIISNKLVDKNYFLMEVELKNKNIIPGQFFMLRGWDLYPTLSRPISVFDKTDNSVSFLYELRGEGTKILSKLSQGDNINLYGPYGNGFNFNNIREISLVGGGVGTAPFYYLSKAIIKANRGVRIDFYIGEREYQNLENIFSPLNDLGVNLIIKKGGFITDILNFEKKLIYTCGPMIMMEKIIDMGIENDADVYVSLENRMGCGVGACLSCSTKTKSGNKRSCKEGPVFRGIDLL